MSGKLPETEMDALRTVSEIVDSAAKTLQANYEIAAAAFLSINKQSEDFALRLSNALAPLQEFNDRLANTFRESQEVIARWAQQGTELVQGIQKFLRELPEHMRTACVELADEGWYIDGDFGAGACGDLIHALRAGNRDWVDEQLIEDYAHRLPAVKAALFARYPRRAKVLRAAFGAHERGEYELSVPVFLAQADGICFEVTGQSMFIKRHGRPAIAEFAEGFGPDEFHTAVLTPLRGVHAIGLTQNDRPSDFSGLNRHQVLHGESVNYDTRLNSSKAISLLSYLEWVLHLNQSAANNADDAL